MKFNIFEYRSKMYIEVQIFKISEAVLQLRELGENEIEVDSCGDTEGLYKQKFSRAKRTIC